MQIQTIWTRFEAFECKFEPFERDSKHSNANSNPSKRTNLEAFECKFEPFERDSKHSNANSNYSNRIQIIQIQIRTTQKGFEAFEYKF